MKSYVLITGAAGGLGFRPSRINRTEIQTMERRHHRRRPSGRLLSLTQCVRDQLGAQGAKEIGHFQENLLSHLELGARQGLKPT